MSTTIFAALGKDFEETVVFMNNNCTIKNLTGFTSNIKVSKFYNSSPVITITGIVQSPATSGAVKYTAPKELLSVLGYGSFFYTRYLYDDKGKVDSLVSGNFIITPSIL